MARSGNTFSFATDISTWANPGVSDPLSISGWNNLRDELVDGLSKSLSNDGNGNMTGPLKLADGSAATPALTFNSDPNTGIYRVSEDVIGVAIGGVVRYRFKSTSAVSDNDISIATTAAVKAAIDAAGGFTPVYAGLYTTGRTYTGTGAYQTLNSTVLGAALTSIITPTSGISVNTTTGQITISTNGVYSLRYTLSTTSATGAGYSAKCRLRTSAGVAIAGTEHYAISSAEFGGVCVFGEAIYSASGSPVIECQLQVPNATALSAVNLTFLANRIG